jgi:isocitrate dehydrogenase (NAD+)
MFPGDGIGPEISQAVLDIFNAVKVPVEWEFHKIHTTSVSAEGDLITPESIQSIRKNKFALKGNYILMQYE